MSRRILLSLILFGILIPASSAQKFNRFNFNVGGGWGGAFHDLHQFTNASYNGVVGGGVNLSPTFGVKAEYMYYNLKFQDSVIQEQSLPGANGRIQSATLNFFWNHNLQGKTSVYAIGGAGWYQRYVDAQSHLLVENSVCQPAWVLWGITCTTTNPPLIPPPGQTLSSRSVSTGGYNFGGGITYRLNRHLRFYVEGRYHHAKTAESHTSIFPITAGLRW